MLSVVNIWCKKSQRDFLHNPGLKDLIITYPVPDRAVLPVNDHIRFVIAGDGFGPVDGIALVLVGSCDPFVTLTAYGPAVFVGYYVLVVSTWTGAHAHIFQNDLGDLFEQVDPETGLSNVGHKDNIQVSSPKISVTAEWNCKLFTFLVP